MSVQSGKKNSSVKGTGMVPVPGTRMVPVPGMRTERFQYQEQERYPKCI